MVFSSTTFLFLFLPITLITYYSIPKTIRNLFLLLTSLFFYAWGETVYLLVMIASIIINYYTGLIIDSSIYNSISKKNAKYILSIGIITNLGLLTYFKYFNFIVQNINVILENLTFEKISISDVHLPIGISFFTFQAVSYLVDIYRGKCRAQRNFINCGLYIALFPQLIAGPIVRYYDVAKQILQRNITIQLFSSGVQKFIFGFSKKVLIANPLGGIADQIFSISGNQLSTSAAWLGIVCYTLQIYYDFSGYSDMAIGLGRMFGFQFLENFNYPYIADSIREFWRRWHISLSSWFRDYLYLPLGGNRYSSKRTYLNLWIVFLLCGLWHGASWNFLVWGALHGALLVFERNGFDRQLRRLWKPLQHIYTLLMVMVAWIFFRAETLSGALKYLRAMTGLVKEGHVKISAWFYFDSGTLFILVMGIIFTMPILKPILDFQSECFKDSIKAIRPIAFSFSYFLLLGSLFFLSVSSLASGTYNPFIYFRF